MTAPYNTESRDVKWENSTLRSFLNGYDANRNLSGESFDSSPQLSFYGTAFSESEKECIISGVVENPENPRYHTDCGDTVNDKVFILSNDDPDSLYSYRKCCCGGTLEKIRL